MAQYFAMKRLEDLAALAALDALDDDQRVELEALLGASDAARATIDEYLEAGALLALAIDPIAPPPAIRQAVLSSALHRPGSRAVLAGEGVWKAHALPGIEYKELSSDPNRDVVMLLMRFGPGARLPAHSHRGAEECYVLEGSLRTGTLHLKRGDFLHADADSVHDALWSDEGGMALLVISREDVLAYAR